MHLPSFVKTAGIQVYGQVGGATGRLIVATTKGLCNIQHEATPAAAAYDGHHIHCIWHSSLLGYFCHYLPRLSNNHSPTTTTTNSNNNHHRHLWLQHPAIYMAPVHNFLASNQVDIVLGSSGHNGKRALEEIVQGLKSGKYSTMVTPDGPAGPPKQVKRGALEMAIASDLPIIPIQVEFESSIEVPSWDRKALARPFSTIIIREKDPIYVTKESFQESLNQLQEELGP